MGLALSRSGVKLDDDLLVDVLVHLVALGQADDAGLELLGIERKPAGHGADAVLLEVARRHLAGGGCVAHVDLVAGQHVVAGDVHLVPVHPDVAVVDELAGRRATLRKA